MEEQPWFADLQRAERTVRAWHKRALEMRDAAIAGDCEAVERIYFDAAMSLPFYGADSDPLPSETAKLVIPTPTPLPSG